MLVGKWCPILLIAFLAVVFQPSVKGQESKKLSIILTQPYTDTGLKVKKGDLISINATGIMNWFTGNCDEKCLSTPNGDTCPYTGFYFQGFPCWSLMGQIVGGSPFFVGTQASLAAPDSGELYLAVNDNYYPDNTGEWTASVKTSPSCGITSKTVANVPLRFESRTKIGVGEVVALSTDDPAEWSIESGGGCLNDTPFEPKQTHECMTPPSKGETSVYFVAPYTTDETVIKAKLADGASCAKQFSVVEPTGTIFRDLAMEPDFPNYGFETYGTYSTFYRLLYRPALFITPGDVSFSNIDLLELDAVPPHIDAQFHSSGLGPAIVGGDTAWFAGCDTLQEDIEEKHKPQSSDSPFAFQDLQGAHRKEFSLVRTELSFGAHDLTDYSVPIVYPTDYVVYTKGQIQTKNESGTFVKSPGLPSVLAVLTSSETTPYLQFFKLQNRFYNKDCTQFVKAQFY